MFRPNPAILEVKALRRHCGGTAVSDRQNVMLLYMVFHRLVRQSFSAVAGSGPLERGRLRPSVRGL